MANLQASAGALRSLAPLRLKGTGFAPVLLARYSCCRSASEWRPHRAAGRAASEATFGGLAAGRQSDHDDRHGLSPIIAIAVKRLHDIGYSGFLALAIFVPLVNIFFTIWVGVAARHGRAEPLTVTRADMRCRPDDVRRPAERCRSSRSELVRAPTVTPRGRPGPRRAGPASRRPRGFAVERPVFQEPGAEPVENLFAAIGRGERHLTLAGHVDVVPPGAGGAVDAIRPSPRTSSTACSTAAARWT